MGRGEKERWTFHNIRSRINFKSLSTRCALGTCEVKGRGSEKGRRKSRAEWGIKIAYTARDEVIYLGYYGFGFRVLVLPIPETADKNTEIYQKKQIQTVETT